MTPNHGILPGNVAFRQALETAERLLAAPADWECHGPMTGRLAEGVRPAASQFAWTAAARWESGLIT